MHRSTARKPSARSVKKSEREHAISVLSITLISCKIPSLRTSALTAVFSMRNIAGNRSIGSVLDILSVKGAGNDPSRIKAWVIGSDTFLKSTVNENENPTFVEYTFKFELLDR